MKSEFTLALNQIGAERALPKEIITRVIETALVTSYRKVAEVVPGQNIAATVDMESGDMRVYLEKEVVEGVMDTRTEIEFADATQQKPDAVLGDCIMVDVTPKDFGRIAAQNAKQLIVQKLREAERDYQFSQFMDREGEIVNGSITSTNMVGFVVNLGRIEATLPRKEMMTGDRFDVGKPVRAYVSEVKRTGRGPQIILSRTNKNFLRRLLEIEVPEIFDNKVEIKSITREAGSRSKIAVAAIQSGVDPVGACVGPRGTRIQSIINELAGEKIDVIEWSADATVFITKALGPAKVLAVHPIDVAGSKNATVVVPDDQLSLAIGREGQNARLAARLTGWRIDIKSGSEALADVIKKIDDTPALKAALNMDLVQGLPTLRDLATRQRAQGTSPLAPDDFLLVKRMLDAGHQFELARMKAAGVLAANAPVVLPVHTTTSEPFSPDASTSVEATPAASVPYDVPTIKAVSNVPAAAYSMALDTLGLNPRIMEHMQKAGLVSVGQLIEIGARGDEGFLGIEGVGAKALAEIKGALAKAEALVTTKPVELAPESISVGNPSDKKETQTPEEEAKAFLAAMAGGLASDTDDVPAADEAADGKDRKSAKGNLVFDEELGRLVVQKPRRRGRGEFGDEEED